MNLKKYAWRAINKINQTINTARTLAVFLITPLIFSLHHTVNYGAIFAKSAELIEGIVMYGTKVFGRSKIGKDYFSKITGRYFEEYRVAEEI